MKRRFLTKDEPMLVSMLQAYTPERVLELMEHSRAEGADAFGMQFCRMKKEYRARETYKRLFAAAGDYPVYVTNYRQGENAGKSDDILARELCELAECGATLCDVMGDYFDRTEGEMTYDERAIEKQMALIDEIHSAGAEVVMSSHVLKYTPAEQVLAIALEHQRRGADICKIVTGASSMEEQIENLRIVTLLKNELDIPFLFLSGGESKILRRIGGEVGCCMYLCVHEHDELATAAQPLISEVRAIRDNLR
ncbi:MAG: type I 3-dehydroquinate dehydratase [Clostridia bacterium]|nr:type I 3-dehydroquinate dehydratase [Clostridia bacterium]